MKNRSPTIEIQARSALSSGELGEIDDLRARVFGTGPRKLVFASPDWHILLRIERTLLSQVSLFLRTGCVEEKAVRLVGIGSVATAPEWRRQGLATMALQGTTSFAREKLDAEFGLLICAPQLIRFYDRLGWREASGPLVFDQPDGKVTFQDVTMILPLRGRPWPNGPIDLCGLPW